MRKTAKMTAAVSYVPHEKWTVSAEATWVQTVIDGDVTFDSAAAYQGPLTANIAQDLSVVTVVHGIVDRQALWTIVAAMSLTALIWTVIAFMTEMTGAEGAPRSVPVLFWLLGSGVDIT